MSKTNITTKTIAEGPAPKSVRKKAAKKLEAAVVTPVVELVEEVKDELNEPVDTFTVRKSWLVVAAVAVTVVLLAVIL